MGRATIAATFATRGVSSSVRRRTWAAALGVLLVSATAAAQEPPVAPADPPPSGDTLPADAPGEASNPRGSPATAPPAEPGPPRAEDAPSRLPEAAPTGAVPTTSESARAEPPSPDTVERRPPVEEEPSALSSPVQIHAFVSQGFLKTNENNYLANSQRGSLEFTEVGINFTKEITDNFRIGAQLFTRDIGPIGNYSAQLDWFYFDYRFFDWLGLRAGRTKLPFGLYNETSDIDAARVPILLPQSVYPIASRDFLLAQTGAELYGLIPLGAAGDLDYRAYGGSLFLNLGYEGSNSDLVKRVDTPYIFGGRLMWRTPLPGLQLGGSVQKLRLELDYALPPDQLAGLRASGAVPAAFNGLISARVPALLAVGSIEYAPGDLLIAAEYSRWRTRVESTLPVVFPDSSMVSERFYVMASYRLNPWFVPGGYYSALFPDADNRSGRDHHQHDFAATLRFDVNPHWLWKLEGHFMRGTAGLTSELNGGAPLATLTRDWLVLLVKTTAYF